MEKADLDVLTQAVAAGDASAYRRLLEVSAKLVRGYVLAKIGGGAMRAEAEDIVQETLLAVHLKYNSYDPSLPYLPWLRTIAHHKLVDSFRRRKINVPLDDILNDTVADPAPQNTDAALTVERLLSALPDKQQKIVRLARIDGKSMAEIAAEMNITVADVKVTLHRALRRLSENVKEHEAA